MTDAQVLTIALATVPTIITVLIGILINNARMSDFRSSVDGRFSDMNSRFSDMRSYMDLRFNDVDHRFDEMKDIWRSELHRVEEVIDARLKHIEDR